MAGQRSFLLVGDSKLVSYKNLAAMGAAQVTFVEPASKSYVAVEVLADCDITRAIDAGYVPERNSRAAKTVEAVSYRVYEDTMVIAGPRKADPVVDVRRVFVWSSGNAGAAVTNRARKLDRAAGDLGRVEAGLGGRFHNTADKVRAKVAAIGADRRVGAYLISDIGTDEAGRPTLAWRWDQTALDAEAAADGWYALLTNLSADEADIAEVLHRCRSPTFQPPSSTAQPETYASLSITAKTSFSERTRIINRLRWHLYELDPTWEPPTRSFDRAKTLDGARVRLAHRDGTVARLARSLVERCSPHLRRFLARLPMSAASSPKTPSLATTEPLHCLYGPRTIPASASAG